MIHISEIDERDPLLRTHLRLWQNAYVLELHDQSLSPDDTVSKPSVGPSVLKPLSPKVPQYLVELADRGQELAGKLLESHQKCQSHLKTTFRKEYAIGVIRQVKQFDLFDITEENRSEAARDLGVLTATIIRQWEANRLTFDHFVALLRINRERLPDFDLIVRSPLLPALALIPVEREFRRRFLPAFLKSEDEQAYRSFDIPSTDVSPLDAVLMSAFNSDHQHIDEMIYWIKKYPHDLRPAAGQRRFQRRLRWILDDALTIADGDPELRTQITKWTCPMDDSLPFLLHFVPLLAQRHFTWQVAFEANHEKMHISQKRDP